MENGKLKSQWKMENGKLKNLKSQFLNSLETLNFKL